MALTYDEYLKACNGIYGMTREQFESCVKMQAEKNPATDRVENHIKPTPKRKSPQQSRTYTEKEKEERRKKRREKSGSSPRTDFSTMSPDEAKEHKLRLKRESAQRIRERKRNESNAKT